VWWSLASSSRWFHEQSTETIRRPQPLAEVHTFGPGAGLLHLDDPDRLRGTGKRWRPLPDALALLWQAAAWRDELRQLLHLLAERTDRRLHPLPWALPVPLRVHGCYSRAEIEAAFGILHYDALDPPRRRPLARTQPHRPAVRGPQQE